MFDILPNVEGVDKIEIPIDIHCVCAIGEETYTNQTLITLENPTAYPEYIGFQKWLYDTYEDKDYNIEQYVSNLCTFLKKACNGKVTVRSYVDDARKHFPVTVTKTL